MSVSLTIWNDEFGSIKTKAVPGFTFKYNITQLVWFESTNDVDDAIAYEKRIKGWKRAKKIALIETTNPDWHDLAADWYSPEGQVPNAEG